AADKRTAAMRKKGDQWENERDNVKRKAEGVDDDDDARWREEAPAEPVSAEGHPSPAGSTAAGHPDLSTPADPVEVEMGGAADVGAIEYPHVDQEDSTFDPYLENEYDAWSEEGAKDEEGISTGKKLEIANMKTFDVFTLVPRDDRDWTNYKWLSIKWVVQQRGEIWRCRLVAREFRALNPEQSGLFTCASTPTTARMIDFYVVKNSDFASVIGDATCAYFHAHQDELVVCEAPEELKQECRDNGESDDVVMVLNRKLYGERSASVRYEEFMSGVLMNEEIAMERCKAQPQFYRNPSTGVALEVHQDDIHAGGPEEELEKLMRNISKHVRMKWSEILKAPARYAHLKNFRVVRADGIFIYPNPKYAADIVKSLGLEKAKSAVTPISETRQPGDEQHPVDAERATLFRHCVSVARFLRNFMPPANYAVKELSHGLSQPNEADMCRLKRFGRWLKDQDGLGIWFPRAGKPDILNIDTDSDWAGDKVQRKSTSSHMIHCGQCLLVDSSKQQTVIAQSSGEAEIYAAAGGTSTGMLMKTVLEFMGFQIGKPRLRVDSKAAKSMAQRYGVGMVRHLEVKILWIQQLCKDKRLSVYKIDGNTNIADLGTKVLAKARIEDLMSRAGLMRLDERNDVPESKVVGVVEKLAQEKEVSMADILECLVALLKKAR
ncbi:MAG TPA: transposon Pol polyprotein, partial [Planctomycetes bacterium]|nr:transposon Pol polyprotein [Planctomycetota bacterium]